MDLIATVSQRNTVDVWRFNGQRVFGLAHDAEDDSTVYDLTWKENGKAGDLEQWLTELIRDRSLAGGLAIEWATVAR